MRQPAVADRFYPGSAKSLEQLLRNLYANSPTTDLINATAVVSPHAGYVYSGQLAAQTIGSINVPECVLILGPNHHGKGKPIALSVEDWLIPTGEIANNTTLGNLLLEHSPRIQVDEIAHRFEHSLEVQVPLLHFIQKNISITPLVISQLSFELCEELAGQIAQAIQGYSGDVLILASSDMNHYQSRTKGNEKDQKVLRAIAQMDPFALYNTVLSNKISMCGMVPVVITLLASQLLGANASTQIGYTDSGDVSGDTQQVVGYAGIVIH